MGEFVLDFSAYNALLSGSNGYGGSYYGADDVFLGGGDPGFSLLTNVGRRHLQHVHNQQQLQQQQQLNRGPAPGSHAAAAAAAGHHNHHRINSRYRVNDRNSLARLEAEKTLQDRRKTNIANFGATWLKPPGVSKTLFQIREECREQEEQAEAERREELAQQLVQAEAAAAIEAEEGPGPEWVEGEGGEGEGDDAAAETTGQEDMDAGSLANEEEDLDLDNAIPDAEDFSFGNNDDGSDDPFASSDEDEDDEESEDDEGGVDYDDNDNNDLGNDVAQQDQGDRTFDQGRPQLSAEQVAYTPQPAGARRRHRESGEGSRAPGMSPFTSLSGAAASFVTPVHAPPALSIEDRREQVRARAAERRETHQMRATEDRVRAMLTQPRLSGLGGLGGGMSGLYGDDDDLDDDDEAQMLQEDDLVRDSIGRAGGRGTGGGGGTNGSRRLNRLNRNSLGNGGTGNAAGGIEEGDEESGDYYTTAGGAGIDNYDQDGDDLEMDMDADLDEGVPEGSSPAAVAMDMDLSTYEDGAYEHTDTEAELSSSVFDGDQSGHAAPPVRTGFPRERSGLDVDDSGDDYDVDDMDFDGNAGGTGDANGHGGNSLPHNRFLAGNLGASGRLSYSRAAPRASNAMAGGRGSTGAHPTRSNLGRSDRNSLDISGLLSQDGSSNVGSSPHQVRWQH